MKQWCPSEITARRRALARWVLICAAWMVVVVLFASQWFAYDVARDDADPFRYYLWWSWFIWVFLTPMVVWFARRHPINSHTWKRAVPLLIAAGVAFTVFQMSVEASLGWMNHSHELTFPGALRHYFSQHTQVSLLAYWVLVGAVQCHWIYDQAQKRELQSAQLKVQLGAAQLEVLRMQLNPHFLFNTLHAATTLIDEDPKGAEDVLLRLSRLLRVSIDKLNVQEIPLRREVEFLEQYLGIQRRRFGDRLRFELQIAEDALDCAVPTLVLQPLVENAVQHGIGRHKESDVISIRSFINQNRLRLEVRNKSSTLEDEPEQLLSLGTGLANTKARLQQLYGDEHFLELRNLKPRGVCVALSIPVRRLCTEDMVAVELAL